MDSALCGEGQPGTDLHTIIYFSWSTIRDNGGDPAAETTRILASAHRNNLPQGITGALLFSEGCFAQVLEGTRNAVEACFERLKTDPRHRGVIQILSAPLAQRSFGAWTMAYAGEAAAPDRRFDIMGLLCNPQSVDSNAAGRDLIATLKASNPLGHEAFLPAPYRRLAEVTPAHDLRRAAAIGG